VAHSQKRSKTASAIRVGAGSAFRSVAVSNLLSRKQLWIWPVLAAILLAISGWWISRAVENAMRERRVGELNTILDADVAALRIWMGQQTIIAEMFADDPPLEPIVQKLLAIERANKDSTRELLQSPEQENLRRYLMPYLQRCKYAGFSLISPDGVVLASNLDAAVGMQLTGPRKGMFDHVLTSGASVSKPFRSQLMLADENGEVKPNLPTMFAAAPIRNAEQKPIAVLALRIQPERELTGILQVARSGVTGETYTFNDKGLMLSESRFDDSLKQVGLLSDAPDSRSVLTLELRDPGVNMTEGARPELRRNEQPLTKMAESAVKKESGVDVNGYRDYRGVPVVGAWTWLPEYDFGVATEQAVSETFAPLYILRTAFWMMFAMLVVAAVAIGIFTIIVARANRVARSAALEAKRLGQYTLDEKLGEGGMGVVYRARHAMLHRPTAVKLLSADRTNEQTIARFEREVQLTARLNHPNTIAIYDYGRTPEGIFYYAMEFLQGINLEDLVKQFGPQPEGRVIFILQQVCGSLSEAHGIGLIHRDIKPANIVLTERGGLFDFVKLLDFGLVKAVDSRKESMLTTAGSLTGTPLYLAPEAIQNDGVDGRADLYALGAVGYFLLTGTPVFDSRNVVGILQKHVMEPPEPPSKRLRKPVSPELEAILLKCLAKEPPSRPQSANELAEGLAACSVASSWTFKEAGEWWGKHYPHHHVASTKPETERGEYDATQEIATGTDR
jgi:tRNA A-37 threonylcarbamoyl transferase component Bud32